MEHELDSLVEEHNVTLEEQAKIYEEMNVVLNQSLGNQKNFFGAGTSDAASGVSKILRINIVMFSVVGVLIAGIIAYSSVGNNNIILTGQNTEVGADILAQEIIKETRDQLIDKNQEIEGLQGELDNVLAMQAEFDAEYAKQESLFVQGLDKEMEEKIAQLEESLQTQSLSQAEIQARLKKEQDDLRAEQRTRLEEFQKEFEESFSEERQALDLELSRLVSRINERNRDVLTLEREIQQQEQKIIEERNASREGLEQIETELLEAQETFKELVQQQENREKELESNTIQMATIVSLMENNEFQKAKQVIEISRRNLANSAHIGQADIVLFQQSYIFMESAIDQIVSTRGSIATSVTDRDREISTLEQSVLEYQARETMFEERIDQKEEEISKLDERIQAIQRELAEEKRKLQTAQASTDVALQAEIGRLLREKTNVENELARIKEGLDARNSFDVIITYLRLRQSGVEDEKTRQLIKDLIQRNEVYQKIIPVIALAIDPTGTLKVDF